MLAEWLSNNSNSIQAVAAIVATFAVLGGAISFSVAQIYGVRTARRESHQYVMQVYRDYLAVALEHPRLRLGYGEPAIDNLDDNERHQRDVGFDLLTSMLELAYLTYATSFRADRRAQWTGWNTYVLHYVGRADYQDWWWRIMLGSNVAVILDLEKALETNFTQLDRRFEAYILPLVREKLMSSGFISNETAALSEQPTKATPRI